jgi:putative transposase
MARAVVAGIAHHVTQRGNRQEKVFFTHADRERYLELLAEYSSARGLRVLAYCLMTNHLHLVVVPSEEYVLAAVLKPVHLRYAQHVNWTHRLTGRLWQGRYFSCPLDDAHTLAAIRYVEQNPVRARLARQAENYAWSSAAGHVGLRPDALLADISGLGAAAGITDWAAWLRGPLEDETVRRLQLCTRTGRPLGSEQFLDRLERRTGRILRPQRGGRPRKRMGRQRKHG